MNLFCDHKTLEPLKTLKTLKTKNCFDSEFLVVFRRAFNNRKTIFTIVLRIRVNIQNGFTQN